MYYASIKSRLKDELEKIEFQIVITNTDEKNVTRHMALIDRVFILINRVFNTFYISIYFYVFPMLLYYVC